MFATLLSEVRVRLRAVFRRRAVDADMDEELRYHLERETEKRIREGDSPAEATRKARAAFGGVERIKDDTRDARGIAWLDVVSQDLRYALRGVRAKPGFASAVVVTLALGIGANAAVFGVVDRLMLRPPAHLQGASSVNRVYLSSQLLGKETIYHNFEFRRYRDLIDRTTSFSQAAAFALTPAAIGVGEDAHQVIVGVASASFFDFFDAPPAKGRYYSGAEDTLPGGPLVAVLDYGYWQSALGGRDDVIGTTMQIGTGVFEIIGVAPRDFTGITRRGPVVWIPLTTYASRVHSDFYLNYNWGWLEMVVRRKPGVTMAAANADISTAFGRSWLAERDLDHSVPSLETARPRAILAATQYERGPESGGVQMGFYIGGVGLIVLLVTCANVANLLLARAFQRRREVAVRLALGVSRPRLIAQLVTESVLLALMGGAAALGVARAGGALLGSLIDSSGSLTNSIADPRVAAVLVVMTLLVGVVTGLAPAMHAGREDLTVALKAGAREGGFQRSRTRTFLVIAQGALSVVLLVGAGLFVRSLLNVRAFKLGYEPNAVLYVQRNMRGVRLPDSAAAELNRRLVATAEAMPTVVSASEAESLPFYSYESQRFFVDGIDSVSKLGRFQLQMASEHFFQTMGTRVIAGRGFTAGDRHGAPLVTVVSESMAHKLWPGRDALGQCIRMNADTMPCTKVVGITEDIAQRELSHTPVPSYYLPAEQYSRAVTSVIVRVRGDASANMESIRRRLQHEMPGTSYLTVTSFGAIISNVRSPWQQAATMLLVFGGLALVVAVIGLYSVVAYNVAQRTHEMGVRIALGARTNDVLRLVVNEGLRFATVGIGVGLALALLAAPPLKKMLFDVSPRDPLVFGIVAASLFAAAAVASVIPAVRAAHVDPNIALRAE